jgi:phenylacetate 2-hydroxylase
MNASFNLTSNDALHVINGVRESRIVYTFAAIALAAVVLSSFEDGRKFLQRIVQFLDGMLGGAPHTVTLPSPPGLPLVGNLLQASCLYKSSVDSSNHCV